MEDLNLRGIAFDGGYGISDVVVSSDGGETWIGATEPGHWHGRDCAGARGEQHQRKHRVGQAEQRLDHGAQAPTANPLAKKIAVTPIRARMIDGFRDAHRWLAELTSDSRQTIESMGLRRDPPTEDDVRNAIERATVSAKRIEIVLSESIVAEGQDRVLTLPWTRTSSRRNLWAWIGDRS